MPAVMMRLKASAFAAGGPFAGKPEHKVRYILQSGVESAPHIAHKSWFANRDAGNPQPPNSVSLVLHGKQSSWFETPLEFNLLPYQEIRAQIANEIERGIIEVVNSGGSIATAAQVRGTLAIGAVT